MRHLVDRGNLLPRGQVDDLDRVVAERCDEEPLPGSINREMVDPSVHALHRDHPNELEGRGVLGLREGQRGTEDHEGEHCVRSDPREFSGSQMHIDGIRPGRYRAWVEGWRDEAQTEAITVEGPEVMAMQGQSTSCKFGE
jgi:hypothetical protein